MMMDDSERKSRHDMTQSNEAMDKQTTEMTNCIVD